MALLSDVLEEFIRAPRKTVESIIPPMGLLKNLLDPHGEDPSENDNLYYMLKTWVRLLNDYYFKVEHIGQLPMVKKVAKKEKVILISNHANTLEGALICYYFLNQDLGRVHPLVFKEAFRLPVLRKVFQSGHCVPIGVDSGTEALKKAHILLFPEGMDFIKHYLKKDYVVKYHKGFLRIAREYLKETGKSHVHVQPVGHDGIDYTLKFWVVNNPTLVKYFIQPYLRYPYFVIPKMPLLFPTTAILNWGRPWKLSLDDLEDDKKLGKLSDEFRHEIVRLRGRARKVRKMPRSERPNPKN